MPPSSAVIAERMGIEFRERNERFASIGDVINRISDLQAIYGTDSKTKIALPRIVVIGSQSVGKSSVLEGIACREFFPRGKGTVTRCPLVLQMHRIPEGQKAWMEFVPSDGKKYATDEEVREEIKARTLAKTKSKDCVVDEPIHLKLWSPQVLDLTLVDLPGLVRVTKESQPSNMKKLVKELVLNYVKEPNTIILAVSAANVDLAASESVEIAKQVDPEGNRTIGVITKVDTVSQIGWEELEKTLTNRNFPLKWGYVGVVNPEVANDSTDCARDFVATREKEEETLGMMFPLIAAEHGTKALQEKLAVELQKHIERTAPQVLAQLKKKKAELVTKLKAYGIDERGASVGLQENPKKVLWEYVRRFGKNLSSIQGFTMNVSTTDLSHGPKLNKALGEIVGRVESVPQPTLDEVKIITRNVLGIHRPVSNPQQAFHIIIKTMVEDRFKTPVMEGTAEIAKIMENCVWDQLKEVGVYPKLRDAVADLMLKKVEENRMACVAYLETFLEVETAFPNFNHPEFIRKKKKKMVAALKAEVEEKQKLLQSDAKDCILEKVKLDLGALEKDLEEDSLRVDWEKQFNADAERCLEEVLMYLEVVEMTIVDQVPKAIVRFVVDKTIEYAAEEILQEEDFSRDVDKLMSLSSERVADIECLQKQLQGIAKGLEEFAKFRQQ